MGTELYCKVSSLLYRRSIFTGIQDTGQSFRSWDSCMANKACKIIAIVGICLAGVFFLWLVGAILSCLREGVTNIATFFCWCFGCRRSSSNTSSAPQVIVTPAPNPSGYVAATAPNYRGAMHQPPQPVAAAQYSRGTFNARSNRDPYYSEIQNRDISTDEMSSDVYELEQDFDLEKQRRKSQRGSRMPQRGVVYDNDDSEIGNGPFNGYLGSTGPSGYPERNTATVTTNSIQTQGYNPSHIDNIDRNNNYVHAPRGHDSFDRHDTQPVIHRPQHSQVPYPDEDVFYTENIQSNPEERGKYY